MLEGRFEAVAVSLPGPSNNGGHHGGQVRTLTKTTTFLESTKIKFFTSQEK